MRSEMISTGFTGKSLNKSRNIDSSGMDFKKIIVEMASNKEKLKDISKNFENCNQEPKELIQTKDAVSNEKDTDISEQIIKDMNDFEIEERKKRISLPDVISFDIKWDETKNDFQNLIPEEFIQVSKTQPEDTPKNLAEFSKLPDLKTELGTEKDLIDKDDIILEDMPEILKTNFQDIIKKDIKFVNTAENAETLKETSFEPKNVSLKEEVEKSIIKEENKSDKDFISSFKVKKEFSEDKVLNEIPFERIALNKSSVKVSKNSLNTQSPEFSKDLANEILLKVGKGIKGFEISLSPSNLGKLSIKVLIENGNATVKIVTETQKALSLMNLHKAQLKSVIDRNFIAESKIEIEKKSDDYVQNIDEQSDAYKDFDDERRNQNNKRSYEESKQNKDKNIENDVDFIQKLRLNMV